MVSVEARLLTGFLFTFGVRFLPTFREIPILFLPRGTHSSIFVVRAQRATGETVMQIQFLGGKGDFNSRVNSMSGDLFPFLSSYTQITSEKYMRKRLFIDV